MKITQLNHVALHVADVDRSTRFYRDMGLSEIDRPAFNFPGAWFRIGADQELHLIARSAQDAEGYSIPRERHWAMRVDDIAAAAAHLQSCGIEFESAKPRPDGAKQIFLRDPDGHVVELCELPG